MKFTFVIFFSAFVVFAKTVPGKKSAMKSSPPTIKKEELLKFLQAESPKNFCDKNSYFAKCFDVLESHCLSDTQESFSDCKNKTEIPNEIDVLDIESYAGKLGECVGLKLEKKWAERKQGTRECKTRF